MTLTVLSTPITAYLTSDLTPVYERIEHLTRTAQLSLGACLLLCGGFLPLIFRKSLHPLKKLTEVTGKIAEGQYHLRADILTPDEVGELSSAFDSMSATIEETIDSLKEAARRTERLSQKMMQLIALTDCPALSKQEGSIAALFSQVENAVQPFRGKRV